MCGFSPNGSFIFAGSSDHSIYVWRWDVQKKVRTVHCSRQERVALFYAFALRKLVSMWRNSHASVLQDRDAVSMESSGVEIPQRGIDIVDIEGAAERKPSQIGRLTGHADDVHLLSVSPDGERVITGSKDGTVRVGSPFPVQPACQPACRYICSLRCLSLIVVQCCVKSMEIVGN